MQHGEQLAPLISRALDEAGIVRQDLTAIAVGVGPGPFTGLRVGSVTAWYLGFVLKVPVVLPPAPSTSSPPRSSARGSAIRQLSGRHDGWTKEVYLASYDEQVVRASPAGGVASRRRRHHRQVAGAGPALYPESFPLHRSGAAQRRSAGRSRGGGARGAARPRPPPPSGVPTNAAAQPGSLSPSRPSRRRPGPDHPRVEAPGARRRSARRSRGRALRGRRRPVRLRRDHDGRRHRRRAAAHRRPSLRPPQRPGHPAARRGPGGPDDASRMLLEVSVSNAEALGFYVGPGSSA